MVNDWKHHYSPTITQSLEEKKRKSEQPSKKGVKPRRITDLLEGGRGRTGKPSKLCKLNEREPRRGKNEDEEGHDGGEIKAKQAQTFQDIIDKSDITH